MRRHDSDHSAKKLPLLNSLLNLFYETNMMLAPALRKTKVILELLASFRLNEIYKRSSRFIYGDWLSYGLRRDISQPFNGPGAKIPIVVRELKDEDIAKLFDFNQPGLSKSDHYELKVREKFLPKNIGTCYVAITEEGEPCYFQWLMGADDNSGIQEAFDRRFPLLKPDEALLENAFTPPRFRGLGIMPCAMAKIAEKAKEMNVRWVLTFVAHDNIPSLKGCHRAGFTPYLIRRDRWMLHRHLRSLSFRPMDGDEITFARSIYGALRV
jgi:RimJ/RimL family protein N-acetyltransferase